MAKTSDRGSFEIYPIKRVDIFESVLEQLSRLVESMEPGERLPPERELVSRLQVSRVSVREALRRLESLGKIEIRPNSGSYVRDGSSDSLAALLRGSAPLDEVFLQNLIDIRAAIEDRVVIKVVARIAGNPKLDLDQVEFVLAESARSLKEGEAGGGSLDLRFEAALGALTDNPLLISLQRSIHQLWVEGWTSCGIAPGNRQKLHDEHVGILDAIRAGDSKLARRRMARHVDRRIGHLGTEDDSADH
jgi:GntR family transcriptional repressor for pyruvate dehydrogenase complex